MLLDLVIQSIQEFQTDCWKLCEKHYPTVHNLGMAEHHLGLAFARRTARTLELFSHASSIAPIEIQANSETPHHYRISSELGTVWVLTQHIVSANQHSRTQLLDTVEQWQNEYSFAHQPNDLLVMISDHWISRCHTSRALLPWWMGEAPTEIEAYQQQGINFNLTVDNAKPGNNLHQEIEQRFNIQPCYLKYTHPLRHTTKAQPVYKYVQLYAVLQW